MPTTDLSTRSHEIAVDSKEDVTAARWRSEPGAPVASSGAAVKRVTNEFLSKRDTLIQRLDYPNPDSITHVKTVTRVPER